MVNTRSFELGIDHYILPRQCEYIFYSQVPGRVGWSFLIRYDPKGKIVKYNVEKEDDIEEEDDVEEQDVANVSNEAME